MCTAAVVDGGGWVIYGNGLKSVDFLLKFWAFLHVKETL